MRKIENHFIGTEGYNCFGCCPTNPLGVKMEFYEDGDEIVSFWTPNRDYQSYQNTLHGGIQAVLMDEIAGWVVTEKLQTTGVTAKLNINYKKHVTTEAPIMLRASIKEVKRNIAYINVQITNHNGELCAEAEAVYFCNKNEGVPETK